MRILLIAPWYDHNVPGESWSTYKWVQGISSRCETTVLTTHRAGWDAALSPTQAVKTVNWIDPKLPNSMARLSHELKPTYPLFYLRARRWLKKQIASGRKFDLIHQINPLALRYPTPAHGLPFPYLIGPLAGSLETPPGFRFEMKERSWFRKIRRLDRLRLRFDPWLRKSYSGAAAVLGVAPYVEELTNLSGCKRFELAGETGVEQTQEPRSYFSPPHQPLKLLFVGRVIRTKGVLDAIRAVAIASQKCSLHFDVIGDGDSLDHCKEEAIRLGVKSIVRFHGRLPRAEIEKFYREADVFLFPSFREPSGNVVFEAMGHGLPVITSSAGGPGYVVTAEAGIRISPIVPDDYATQLSEAIETLANDRKRLPAMSVACVERMRSSALWEKKVELLLDLYQQIIPKRLQSSTLA